MTDEKQPEPMSVSFSAPSPKAEPTKDPDITPGKIEIPAVTKPAAPVTPTLEIDLGAAPEQEITIPTAEEADILSMDADDPTALLAQQFGRLPGVKPARAAKMAKGSQAAMHNLTVRAKRDLDLARRQAMREMGLGHGKKGKKGRNR